MWGQKAPSKHENGGKKRPQNHKVGAESAPAQIRAEKSVGAKSAVKMQKWGQKAPSKLVLCQDLVQVKMRFSPS